ncbi:hypothetical protein AB4455_02310 [Vibrio sp. 10N.261.46.E12]|nr:MULTISPECIES: hypothetical protein [unclassified Vibrio]PMN82539.1 hypothetical protein BCT22_13280 [Vibrio sp. 10N.261.45.A1]OMO35987.1 hypothetical protein BH584_06225 [Vibrio sp. 10N.261.45.E1]PMJ19929.1 hypothetical protein BCU27_20640 [Vibrio sp. 10N.286.45.B6]PML85322.1 hypothetical protein BCT66_16035 [Vibrio sp. 10N.261.49.E11]PMM72665.1 hypothetical protein BCT48_06000 [Vibrio sp. 10N.261.46.F12]
MKFPEGVYLFHIESLKDQYFDEFAADLNAHGIQASVHSRRDPGLYACNEWLIPTAIIAGISAGFLNEAGKDLYQVAKSKLAELCTTTIKKPRIEPVLIGSEGKINSDNPYSSGFSIYSEANMGRRFKLLIPKYSAQVDYNKIVHAYLDFLKDYNDDIVAEIDIGIELLTILPSSTILVRYNESTKSIEWVDHIPAHIREGMSTI